MEACLQQALYNVTNSMQLIFTVDKEIMTLLDMETRPILNLGEADPNCKLVDGALFKVSAVKDMVEAARRRERRQRHGRSRLFVCVCVYPFVPSFPSSISHHPYLSSPYRISHTSILCSRLPPLSSSTCLSSTCLNAFLWLCPSPLF